MIQAAKISELPDAKEQPLVEVELIEIRWVPSQHHEKPSIWNIYLPEAKKIFSISQNNPKTPSHLLTKLIEDS